jgi:cyclopropane-fatty-acyl-phospholipid synthase
MIKGLLTTRIKSQLSKLNSNYCIVLPDGNRIKSQNDSHPVLHLTLKEWETLGHLAQGEIGRIASDWVEGKIHIDGCMRDLIDLAASIVPKDFHRLPDSALAVSTSMLQTWLSRLNHTRSQSKFDIQSHYDITDDFYSIWLDEEKVYSCAYFECDDATLKEAQKSKLDLICRKLDLSNGERFLDIGMGWGALLFWAAENYGVRAHGITLSMNQYEHVQRQIAKRGLENRVTVSLMDYRDLSEKDPFDKISSVGMFEHVGRANMNDYFDKIYRLLKPGGIIMNHGITAGHVSHRQLGLGIGEFIEKYIFPNGELIHLSEVSNHMTHAKLELVDAECLRPHYAKTLWAWSDQLEINLTQAHGALEKVHGTRATNILRAYRMYLSGCALGFEQGWISIYQVLAVRSDANSSYPYRRDYMYAHRVGSVKSI